MAVTTFIPQIWSARLLYNLDKSHVATNFVNRNYEGLIRNQGDTVKINSIGDINVFDYTRNTDMEEPQVLETTEQTLVIDQAKAFNFTVDDVDKVQAAGDLMDTAMSRAAYKLSDVSDAFLLGVIAAGAATANTISGVKLTSGNVYENMVALRTLLDKANVPTAGRSVVIPPDVYALLLMDDRFVKASDSGTANSVLLSGQVGRVAGLEVYLSNNVVVSEGTYTITAQVPYATTYAEQIISTEAYRMEKRFSDAVKGLHVYGAKVTDGNAIAALKCTV
jgi:N4-gp56 family major capsid protein